MSGPKSSDYHVISEAELRRRRIAAAEDRYSRVLAAVESLQADISAARATYGDLEVSIPQVTAPDAREAADRDRASDALTTGLAAAQWQLEKEVRTSRLRILSAEGSRVSAVLSEESRPRRSASSTSAEAALDDGKLADVLGRLPAAAPADVVSRCESLALGYQEAATQSERAQVLDAILFLVQAGRDRQALIDRNGIVIEDFYRELDGLSGETLDTLRGALKGLDRSVIKVIGDTCSNYGTSDVPVDGGFMRWVLTAPRRGDHGQLVGEPLHVRGRRRCRAGHRRSTQRAGRHQRLERPPAVALLVQ